MHSRKMQRRALVKALVQHSYGARDVPDIQQRLARVSGLLYLVIAVFGMFATTVLQNLVIPGDAPTAAHNILDSSLLFGSSLAAWILIVIADIAVALTLYLLLAIVNSLASFFAADYTGVASTAVLASALLGELGLTAWHLVKGLNVRR